MAMNTSGPISLAGSTAGQSIAVQLNLSPTGQISLNQADVRALAGKASGAIVMPTDFYGKSSGGTNLGVFGFGTTTTSNQVSITNKFSNVGVFTADVTVANQARLLLAATSYGGNKGKFGFGGLSNPTSVMYNTTNNVSETGVFASDTSGVGTARYSICATTYGGDKGMFCGGSIFPPGVNPAITNLISNTGVLASDNAIAVASREGAAAAGYGGDKGIMAYGLRRASPNVTLNTSNLISNTGVVGAEQTGIGTARNLLNATSYGGDKAMFINGQAPVVTALTNLVSNTGVVAANNSIVGQFRYMGASSVYGGDKALFAYGFRPSPNTFYNIVNLISNTGVVGTDVAGVGTGRRYGATAGYG